MTTINLLGQNQGQSDPVKEFMNQVENLDLNKVLKFVNENLMFTYTPNNETAIDLAYQIKDTPRTKISTVQYISALKYLTFFEIASHHSLFLDGKNLWEAAISGDLSHFWPTYLIKQSSNH